MISGFQCIKKVKKGHSFGLVKDSKHKEATPIIEITSSK